MIKQATLFAALIAVTQLSYAGDRSRYLPEEPGDTSLTSIPAPQQLLQEIISVIGLQSTFELKEADVQNIQASISHRKRYILYNPQYITWINRLTRNKWCTMALIAHEVGHHLNGHTIRKGGSSPAVELEADEFAGFVLYKLGASLEQAQEVMKYIAGMNGSDTHPGRLARMKAIQTGWEKAEGSN